LSMCIWLHLRSAVYPELVVVLKKDGNSYYVQYIHFESNCRKKLSKLPSYNSSTK